MIARRGTRVMATVCPDDGDSKSEICGGETESEVEVEDDDDDQLSIDYVEVDDDDDDSYSFDSNTSSNEWETIEGDDDEDYCVDSVSEEEEDSDCGKEDNDEDTLRNRVVQFLLEKNNLEKLTLKECRAYLRKHGLKISGTKASCLQRIEDHWCSDRQESSKGDDHEKYCNGCPSKEEGQSDCGKGDSDDDTLCDRVIQFLQGKKELGKLSLKECKAYLRKHHLRLSGTKAICLQRIQEHWRVKDGNGEAFYPISSFTVNCTGDVCKGDVVLFTQKVYAKFDKVTRNGELGRRVIAGRVVKESYGDAKQQHTFTVEVLWSKGTKKLPPLSPLLVKGRNLYRYRTLRQLWGNEVERSKFLAEKHKRGAAARQKMAMRKQTKPTIRAQGKGKNKVQCSSCKECNHIACNCPKSKIQCFSCKEYDHIADKCPKNKVQCYGCKEYDHIARNCPKSKVHCFSCMEYGHIARNCTKKSCNYCKKAGHIIKDCPVLPQNRQSQAFQGAVQSSSFATSSSVGSKPLILTPSIVQQVFCNYCKKEGHIIKDCPVLKNCRRQAFQPVVQSSSFATSSSVGSKAPTLTPSMVQQIFCNYCKKEGHIIKDCPVRPQNRQCQVFQAAVQSSSFATSSSVGSKAPVLTPTMVQQMLVPGFTTLHLDGLDVRRKE